MYVIGTKSMLHEIVPIKFYSPPVSGGDGRITRLLLHLFYHFNQCVLDGFFEMPVLKLAKRNFLDFRMQVILVEQSATHTNRRRGWCNLQIRKTLLTIIVHGSKLESSLCVTLSTPAKAPTSRTNKSSSLGAVAALLLSCLQPPKVGLIYLYNYVVYANPRTANKVDAFR